MSGTVLAAVAAAHVKAMHVAPAVMPADAPPGVESKWNMILGWLKWAGAVAVIAGIIIVGIKVALNNSRGEGEENMKRLGYVILGGILMSAAGAIGQAVTS